MAVLVDPTGQPPVQLVVEEVARQGQPSRAAGEVGLGEGRSLPESGDERDVFGPGAQSVLLAAAVDGVAYCRGAYCVLAHDAVRLLTADGRRAVRLAEGMLEWRLAGSPVATAS